MTTYARGARDALLDAAAKVSTLADARDEHAGQIEASVAGRPGLRARLDPLIMHNRSSSNALREAATMLLRLAEAEPIDPLNPEDAP